MRWRLRFLAGLVAVATLVMSGRLFYLTVWRHNDLVSQAKEQQTIVTQISPKRGSIFLQDFSDGTKVVAAQSIETYAVSATPSFVVHKQEYADVIAKHTGVAAKDLLDTFKAGGMYMNPIKHGLSKADVESLAVDINAVDLKFDPSIGHVKVNFDSAEGNILYYLGGVIFLREYQRVYPEGATLGQVLGFVDNDGNGQYGFEQEYDNQLRGYAGQIKLERDGNGNLLDRTSSVNWQDGADYTLTIDRNIQQEARTELAAQIKQSEAKGGSVIIMDPKTGAILAMANQPDFDPNKFSDVAKDQTSVYQNPAVSGLFEPGSIMKPLVMAAALDQGVVTPETTNDFAATVTVDGYTINTALRKAYGVENMAQVLANSDNVAMVWVANKLGNQNLYNYLQKFGFAGKTNVDLISEASGTLQPVNKWSDVNRATMSFGQGIAVTPLQILTAYSAIVNDGRMVKPHIVSTVSVGGSEDTVKPTFGEQIFSAAVAKQLRDMLVYVVTTAHNRAGVAGYIIGGKTGTAQIPDPTKGGYVADAYNHSFIGFGPSNNPRFLMMVKIDQPNLQKVGLYAEATAVPLFSRLSQFLLNYYQIPPEIKTK
jgi:cell division protein FtsI/penicillin-binding protein 2